MAKRRPSGDGMVRLKKENQWEGRIVVGHKQNGDSIFRYAYGKRMARNIYAPTREECEEKLAILIKEMKAEIAEQKAKLKNA